MRILFVTANHYPYDGACTSILKKLLFDGGLFQKADEVHVLTFKYDYQEPDLEEIDGVIVHRTLLWSRMSSSQMKKSFIKHPLAIGSACAVRFLRKLYKDTFLKPEMCKSLYRALRRIDGDTFDTIVPIAGDFETVQAVWMLKRKAPSVNMVIYQVDPCSTNLMAPPQSVERRMAFEDKVYAAAKAVITTDIISQEQAKRQTKAIMSRFMSMEFPVVLDDANSAENGSEEREDISCLFAGSVYGGIRDPRYTLRLFEKIKETVRIGLHMVGVNEKDLDVGKIPENVRCRGRLTLEKTHEMTQEADVLVNIGNIMKNQVPSKIFDYIATGKPIINICKNRDCPTLKYLEKYPLCLNLFEEEEILEEQAQRMERFILENHARRANADNLALIYRECMADYCAEQMYNAMM